MRHIIIDTTLQFHSYLHLGLLCLRIILNSNNKIVSILLPELYKLYAE